MQPRNPQKIKTNRSTVELLPDLIAELNEFALQNRMLTRVDAIRYLLRYALTKDPKLPPPAFTGARAVIDLMGNFSGWSADL